MCEFGLEIFYGKHLYEVYKDDDQVSAPIDRLIQRCMYGIDRLIQHCMYGSGCTVLYEDNMQYAQRGAG